MAAVAMEEAAAEVAMEETGLEIVQGQSVMLSPVSGFVLGRGLTQRARAYVRVVAEETV